MSTASKPEPDDAAKPAADGTASTTSSAAKPAAEPATNGAKPAAEPATNGAKPAATSAAPAAAATAATPAASTAAAAPAAPVAPAAAVAPAAVAKPVAAKPAPKPAAAAPKAPEPEVKLPEPKVPRSAIELRAARRRILQRRYGIWVGIPTLLAIVYYLFIATPQYDATMSIAVESSEGRVDKTPNAGNVRDARLLREALRSGQALAALDKDGAFRKHYKENGDWMSRLGASAGPDTTLDYFRDKVHLTQETGTSLTTVRVRAFSGEAAHDFATKLLGYAKTWVTHQNEASSAARLKQAVAEVTREREALAKAADALAKAEQPKPTDPVAIDHQLAEKRLEAALKGHQEALLEVGRSERYLVVLDEPSQPDSPALPRRAWGILSVFVAAIVLVSVLSLLGASVREHAKF